MKKFLLVLTTVFSSLSLQAAEPAEKKPVASTTQHSFEELLVQGQYHFSDEAVTTVEADKVFDSLIGVRSDFKDRLEESASKQ